MKNIMQKAADAVKNSDKTELMIYFALLIMLLPDKITAVIVSLLSISLFIFRKTRKKLLRSPTAPTFLPMAVILIAPAVISGFGYGIIAGVGVFFIIIFAVYLSETVRSDSVSRVLDSVLIFSAVSALYGFYCQSVGILELGRVRSFFENPNHYAYALEMFVFAALSQYLRHGKPLYLLAAAGNMFMNLLCGCRTAWVAIFVGTVIFLLMSVKRRWLLPSAAASATAGAAVLFALPETGGRLSYNGMSHSFDNRIHYWKNAYDWFLRRPLTGWGVSGYELLSEREGERVLAHAHNMPLNILLDTGIIGFVILGIFAVIWLRRLFSGRADKANDPVVPMASAMLAATLIHGVTDFPLLGVSTSLIFLIMLSLTGAYESKEE